MGTDTVIAGDDGLRRGFRLGDAVEVEPTADLLRTPQGTVHLEPRVMDVLVALARHPGETLSRDALMDAVWGDTVVGDEVLSRAVSLLRSALGDERTTPRYIRTVPRRGYQLVASVMPLEPAAGRSPSSRIRWLALGAAVGVVALLGLLIPVVTEPADASLAVIPFDTSRVEEADRFAGEALADQLIRRLTGVPALTVIARRASFQVRDVALDIHDIGERLDARYLVEGAIDRVGDRLRLTLFLVDSDRGSNLWTDSLEGSRDDLLSLGDAAYGKLSVALARHLDVPAAAAADPVGGAEKLAYRRLLEARYQWSLRGEGRLQRAVGLLEEAIELQPDFAVAHLALAEAVAALAFYTDGPPEVAFEQARGELDRAVSLDPDLEPEADALRGMMLMREQRWQMSIDLLEGSLSHAPDSVYGNYWYSMLLSSLGRYEEALQHIQRAHRLDPLSAVINDRLALAYVWVGDLNSAGERYRESARLGYLESTQPKPLALYYYRLGQYQEIARLFRRVGSGGAWLDAFVAALEHPDRRSASAEFIDAEIRAGRLPRALWFGIWVLLQDADRAVRDFDDSLATQDIEVLWSAEAEFLRRDPRFPMLLRRVGLDDPTLPIRWPSGGAGEAASEAGPAGRPPGA